MALSLEKWGSSVYESDRAALLLEELSRIDGILFNPPARLTEPEHYYPGIINFSLPPLPGEVLQRILNEKGFCISIRIGLFLQQEKPDRRPAVHGHR